MRVVLFSLYLILGLFAASARATEERQSQLPCNEFCRWWLDLPSTGHQGFAAATGSPVPVATTRRARYLKPVMSPVVFHVRPTRRIARARLPAHQPLRVTFLVPRPAPMPPAREVSDSSSGAVHPAPGGFPSEIPSTPATAPNPSSPRDGAAWERAALRIFEGNSEPPPATPH